MMIKFHNVQYDLLLLSVVSTRQVCAIWNIKM